MLVTLLITSFCKTTLSGKPQCCSLLWHKIDFLFYKQQKEMSLFFPPPIDISAYEPPILFNMQFLVTVVCVAEGCFPNCSERLGLCLLAVSFCLKLAELSPHCCISCE